MGSKSGFLTSTLLPVLIFCYLADVLKAQCVDKSDECRTMLQAHYCYLEHNRELCCQSCKRFETGNPDCQYGDHVVRISRNTVGEEPRTSGTRDFYTCESYVSFFGYHHCANDLKFKEYCCKSCSDQ